MTFLPSLLSKRVPLLEPRSVTSTPSTPTSILQCSRLTLWSSANWMYSSPVCDQRVPEIGHYAHSARAYRLWPCADETLQGANGAHIVFARPADHDTALEFVLRVGRLIATDRHHLRASRLDQRLEYRASTELREFLLRRSRSSSKKQTSKSTHRLSGSSYVAEPLEDFYDRLEHILRSKIEIFDLAQRNSHS